MRLCVSATTDRKVHHLHQVGVRRREDGGGRQHLPQALLQVLRVQDESHVRKPLKRCECKMILVRKRLKRLCQSGVCLMTSSISGRLVGVVHECCVVGVVHECCVVQIMSKGSRTKIVNLSGSHCVSFALKPDITSTFCIGLTVICMTAAA